MTEAELMDAEVEVVVVVVESELDPDPCSEWEVGEPEGAEVEEE